MFSVNRMIVIFAICAQTIISLFRDRQHYRSEEQDDQVDVPARTRSQSDGTMEVNDKNQPNRPFQRSHNSFIPNSFNTYINELNGVLMINPIFYSLANGKNARCYAFANFGSANGFNDVTRDKEHVGFRNISQAMCSIYIQSLTELFPFKSDPDFSINFKDSYAVPLVSETILRIVDTNESIRIYLQAPFGGGKRTFLRKIVSDWVCGSGYLFQGRSYRLPLLCDIGKFNDVLETDSMESVLLDICNNYATEPNLNELKQTIKCNSKHILCLISGYETLSTESKKTVDNFFRRDIDSIENANVFRFSSFILASADVFESFPKLFRSSFDTLIKLQGLPQDWKFALLSNYIGVEKAANMREKLHNLNMMFLMDNSQILPQIVVSAGCVYEKFGVKDRCHFLGKMIKRQLVEYLSYHDKLNFTDHAIKAKAEEILIRIGRQVYSKMLEETQNSFFNVNPEELSDLKLLSNLGWIDLKTLQPTHRLPIEYLVVKYLNSTIAGVNLEDALLKFAQHGETYINVIVRTEGKNSYLKHMYVTSSRNLFVLDQYRVQDHFAIKYFMYEDFQDVLDQENPSLFSIEVTKRADLTLGLLQSRFSVCPIRFNGDHFVTTLMDSFTDEITMLVKYPVENNSKKQIIPNKSSYSYCVHVNEVENAFTFSLSFDQDDCKTVANFVSGFNQVLLNVDASVPFSISQKSLRIHLSDFCNALKLLHVCFGLERDQNDPESTVQLLRRCATHLNDNFIDNSWVMKTGAIPIATSADMFENETEDFAHPLPDLTNRPLDLVLNLTE